MDSTPAAGPLVARRITSTFDLSDAGFAEMTVGSGTADRQARTATLLAIVDLLNQYLQADRISAVVRRPAEAYGDRSLLEMCVAGDEREALRTIRGSFDFGGTA